MVAAYLGVGKSANTPQNINDAAEFVPVNTVSTAEFDALLASHGLPIGDQT